MDSRRIELTAVRLKSLAWNGDELVDWLSGTHYALDGRREEAVGAGGYRFDAAIGLDGIGVAFETLGTKGIVVRDNGKRQKERYYCPAGVDILREIDRSYSHADDYCFPVALFRLPNGRSVLAHCPRGYNVIDLEDVDGTCLTPRSTKGAEDVFHSRLDASLNGRWLLSNGWVWHPMRIACVYEVERALVEHAYLSTTGEKLELWDDWQGEVEGAAFVGDRLVCATNEEKPALTIYDLDARRHEALIELKEEPGTRLMAHDPDHVWLFDRHPRLLRLSTGQIVERLDDLEGGAGVHQPSVNMRAPEPPWLAMDPGHRRFALGWPDRIVVVLGGG